MKLILLLNSIIPILCLRIDIEPSKNNSKSGTGWQTCSSCDAHHPRNSKQLLLELDLFRDRVDFQFETMIANLSNKILNIENNIDISARQSLDKVRESLLELAVKIKSSLKQQLDDFRDIITQNFKRNNSDNLEIEKFSQSLNKLGKLSKEFTTNGTGSLEILELSLARDYKNDMATNDSDKPLDIDAAEDFVFKTVPPKAIIKMLETFKSDMTTEGSKLIHNVDALKRLIE